jgi:hypothetical protein
MQLFASFAVPCSIDDFTGQMRFNQVRSSRSKALLLLAIHACYCSHLYVVERKSVRCRFNFLCILPINLKHEYLNIKEPGCHQSALTKYSIKEGLGPRLILHTVCR